MGYGFFHWLCGGPDFFSLAGGKFIDKFSALALLPFYLIPFAVGLAALTLSDQVFIAPVYLMLTGISEGLSSPLSVALLAEIYGIEHLGGIRAMLAAVTVFSTALSPALFGFLLDQGVNFKFISGGSFVFVLVAVLLGSRLPLLNTRVERKL